MSHDAIIAALEHLQPRASPRPANIQTSSTGPCTFSFQDSKIVEGEQHRAKRYPGGLNPLACHTDVWAFAQPPGDAPVTRVTPPRIYIDHDDDNNIGEAIIYSPSLGDLTSYARQTPSPAKTSYDSRDKMEKDIGETSSEDKTDGDRAKDSSGITRSITGLFAKVGSKKKDKDKGKLTATPTSTSLGEPEKPADILLLSHTPQKPSPLREVQSVDSLTSLDKELLRNY
jgi:hypothetical protein